MNTVPAALQFMFAPGETPWAPLPNPGAKPTNSTQLDATVYLPPGQMTVASGEVVTAGQVLYHQFNLGDFFNNGTLWVENGNWHYTWIFGTANWGVIENNGDLVSLSKTGIAAALHYVSWGVLQNHGRVFAVSKELAAWGVYTWSQGLFAEAADPVSTRTPFLNTGEMYIWAGTKEAVGFYFVNGARVVNSGLLDVAGFMSAYGLFFEGGAGFVENSGIINVISHDTNPAVGVYVNQYHSQTAPFEIHNDGTISANIAIWSEYYHYNQFPNEMPSIEIENTGSIHGAIVLQDSHDQIVNSGSIIGNIDLGRGDDLYDGRDGNLTGTLLAGDGDDAVVGGVGADSFSGGFGNDTIDGGAGNDVIDGGGNQDNLFGSAGADTLLGNNGNDTLAGGTENDTLSGGKGFDYLWGQDGADSLSGDDLSDTLLGGGGGDTLHGGADNDRLFGEAQRDLIFGDAGDDFVDAGTGDDTVDGGGQRDSVFGGSGFDSINGGAGNDTLTGGTDGDTLDGGAGFDVLQGDAGDDVLNGGASNDVIFGNAGNDRIEFNLGGGVDTLRDFTAGAASEDTIRLVGFGAAFDSFAEVLAAATDNGVNTTIDFGGGDILIIRNVLVSELHADDFSFG